MIYFYKIYRLAIAKIQKPSLFFVQSKYFEKDSTVSTGFTYFSSEIRKGFFFRPCRLKGTQIGHMREIYSRDIYGFSSYTCVRKYATKSNWRPDPRVLQVSNSLAFPPQQKKESSCFAKANQKKQTFLSEKISALPLKQNTQTFKNRDFSTDLPEIFKLFVNLLMKDGKKTKALYIFEAAALYFMQSISKTDLYPYPNTNTHTQKALQVPISFPFLFRGGKIDKKTKEEKKIKKMSPIKRKISSFSVHGASSLDPVLQNFYINQNANPNLATSSGSHPSPSFLSSPLPIRGAIAKVEDSIGKDVKSERHWYAYNRTERWHQLSDIQKNTLYFALYTAISNVKPPLEVRSKRVGGGNRQIPAALSESRQRGIAIRWIIESAKMEKAPSIQRKKRQKPANLTQNLSSVTSQNKDLQFLRNTNSKRGSINTSQFDLTVEKGRSNKFLPLFSISLGISLKNAFYKKGPAFQKRNLWIETAMANRSFLRYRWW